jgi:hypothetical protein
VLANPLSFHPLAAPNALQLMQLRKAILKLRWTGQEDEAERLLVRLSDCGPSEICPMDPLETD